ncbi:hypothetical protein V2I01_40590 [Micromonospora sp. BRA006-A]|nr:hypothetical protein [Micromonospora sp. BRA006-A]
MPAAVVDLLEVVQVEHDRDERLAGGVGEQGGGQPEEGAAVGQPGERVVAGGVPLGGQFGLEQLDLGFGAQRARRRNCQAETSAPAAEMPEAMVIGSANASSSPQSRSRAERRPRGRAQVTVRERTGTPYFEYHPLRPLQMQ